MSADFQKMPDAELVALAEKCGAQQCGMEGEFLGFSSVEQLRAFHQEATRQAMERKGPSAEEVCAEFDALSQRMNGWNTLGSVNAAWHAFKCGVQFAIRALAHESEKR